MAQIFPYKLNLDETPSRAERRLYELLQKCLNDEYTVFHSRALQAKNDHIGIADREIDFLIAHPNRGLLVVEVKGGQITADERSGRWLQNGKQMKKTPIKQVRDAMYDLQRALKDHPTTRSYDYAMSYVLALPDVHLTHDLTADAPRAIVLDKSDCLESNIVAAIDRIHRHYNRPGAPGVNGVKALTSILVPLHILTSKLSKDFEAEEEHIKVLTEEQYDVLLDLANAPRYLITGCAGSGKTMLAFEKARRLKQEGKRVLLVYYTSALARWMTDNAPQGVEVMYFHELCRKLGSRPGSPIPDYNPAVHDAGDYYDGILPNRLLRAAELLADEQRYDAIIVDEGQDFRRSYWPALMALLRDPENGIFYIFCDESQRIFTRDVLPFREPHRHLRKNLRNIRTIGQLVGKYHATGKPEDYQPAGPEVERHPKVIDIAASDDWLKILRDTLHDLHVKQNVPLTHIAILTPFGEERSRLKDGSKLGEFTLTRKLNPSAAAKEVTIATVQSFKGMERPAVILTEFSRFGNASDATPAESRIDVDTLLYVATSRAKNHLIVIGKLPDARTRDKTKAK